MVNQRIGISIKTETPSTIAKTLVTTPLSIIMLLLWVTSLILTSAIGYLTVRLPQPIPPEKIISYRIDILLWCSVTIYSSYIKHYYNKLINPCGSVGASFTKWEFAQGWLALGEHEIPEIGCLPGSFIFTESEPAVLGTSPRDTNSLAETPAAPLAPGPTAEEAPGTSGEHSPSPPNTLSEETRTKGNSPKPKEGLPRRKSAPDENATDRGSLYARTPPVPLPTVRRPLRWHSGGKYLDGTRIPPRRKQNTYTAEPPTTPKEVTPASQGETKTTAPENNEERGLREGPDISDLLSPESNSLPTSTPSQDTPSRQSTLWGKASPLQAESLTSPHSPSPSPARRRPRHKRPEQLISQNQNNLSIPDSNPDANKDTFPEDEDTVMEEVPWSDSSYVSNAMGDWGTTREPIKKEIMVVAVSTSWSNDWKASFSDRDYLDGVLEEDILRITNVWAAALLEVCERKLAKVVF